MQQTIPLSFWLWLRRFQCIRTRIVQLLGVLVSWPAAPWLYQRWPSSVRLAHDSRRYQSYMSANTIVPPAYQKEELVCTKIPHEALRWSPLGLQQALPQIQLLSGATKKRRLWCWRANLQRDIGEEGSWRGWREWCRHGENNVADHSQETLDQPRAQGFLPRLLTVDRKSSRYHQVR